MEQMKAAEKMAEELKAQEQWDFLKNEQHTQLGGGNRQDWDDLY